MRALAIAILVGVTAGSAAAADYACPDRDGLGRCPFASTAPEGCPVHFLLAGNPVPADVRATVERGGMTVDVTGEVTTQRVERPVGTKDYYSCDCAEISGPQPFDEYSLTLNGALAGEVVTLSAPVGGEVTIGAAAACPAFTYDTDFYIPIACDLCPGDDEPGGDDGDGGGGGCAVTPSGSGPLFMLAALFAVTRRRSRLR